MRKNLITVITLALVLVNLVLTAIMAVAIMPEINKVNALVTKVSDAINLDISSNPTGNNSNISVDQLEIVSFENKMTINLKDSGDGVSHMAIVSPSLSVNRNSDIYESYPEITQYESLIKGEINNIVTQYTIEELKEDPQAVLNDICEDLNSLFGGDLIANVTWEIQYQ